VRVEVDDVDAVVPDAIGQGETGQGEAVPGAKSEELDAESGEPVKELTPVSVQPGVGAESEGSAPEREALDPC
jgi:hypothetical protein